MKMLDGQKALGNKVGTKALGEHKVGQHVDYWMSLIGELTIRSSGKLSQSHNYLPAAHPQHRWKRVPSTN